MSKQCSRLEWILVLMGLITLVVVILAIAKPFANSEPRGWQTRSTLSPVLDGKVDWDVLRTDGKIACNKTWPSGSQPLRVNVGNTLMYGPTAFCYFWLNGKEDRLVIPLPYREP